MWVIFGANVDTYSIDGAHGYEIYQATSSSITRKIELISERDDAKV